MSTYRGCILSMSFLDDLNKAQLEAVKAVNGPAMIIAAAGSGKTRALTYRIAYLISLSVRPQEILALTFTNKAANEMKNRIINLVGPDSQYVWMGTFHSIFARILRSEAESIGFGRNFTIYDTDDSHSSVKNVMNSLGIAHQQFNPHAVRARISGAKNQLVTPKKYKELAKDIFEEKAAKVYEEYEKKLKLSNAMDFDDLLVKPIELFERYSKILEKYQHRFKYILVDEYQDTNRAQYVLIKLLAQKHCNICVVGDDAQSIYAFRGADIRNILDFEKDYPDCKIFRLEQNYRSTKNILAAADGVIKNNREQIPKNLWAENSKGDLVTILECEDDKDEGHKILHRIQEDSIKYKLDLNDFAILYRTNAQSRSLEDSLRRAGIPYTIVGGIEFYKRKEIKDILAYLKVIVNSNDEESLLRIMNYPSRGIGETTIRKLQEYARKYRLSLYQTFSKIQDIPALQAKLKTTLITFGNFLRKYIQLKKEMSASELARALVDELGILKTLKEEATAESIARWENIQELLSALTEYCADHPQCKLENFLEEVSLIADVDTWDDKRNVVTLMTLHSAKGLEFPVVFITGLEEGLFPLYTSALDRTELEEERRLFYVGITRTMRKLYLTYTRIRYRFGDITFPTCSRFIDEIDPSLTQIDGKRNKPLEKEKRSNDFVFDVIEEYSVVRRVNGRKRKKESEHKQDFSLSSSTLTNSLLTRNNNNRTIRVGTKVGHETFGIGQVIDISGKGGNAKAIVVFETSGKKHLLLKYAKLKVLSF